VLQSSEKQTLWRRLLLTDNKLVDGDQSERVENSLSTSEISVQTTSSLLDTRYVAYYSAPTLPPPHRVFKAVRAIAEKQFSSDVAFSALETAQHQIPFSRVKTLRKVFALCICHGPPASESLTDLSLSYDWNTHVLQLLANVPTHLNKVVLLARRKADRRGQTNIARIIPPDNVRERLGQLGVAALLEMDFSPEVGYGKTSINKQCNAELAKLLCSSKRAQREEAKANKAPAQIANPSSSAASASSVNVQPKRRVLAHERSLFDELFD
jgi:hypothetical protein